MVFSSENYKESEYVIKEVILNVSAGLTRRNDLHRTQNAWLRNQTNMASGENQNEDEDEETALAAESQMPTENQ